MPKTPWVLVAAGVAVALGLPLLSMSPSSADAARPAGAHARALAALDAVRSALDGPPRPAAGRQRPRADLTLLLRDLRMARAHLSRSEQATADTYLARPSLSSACSGTIVVSGHFCVHYTAPGLVPNPDAATPEQAQLTADTLAAVWNREIGSLGFRVPPSDGDAYFDVYLQDVGSQGYYGYCAPDHATAHSSSYCVLDNDFDPNQFGGAPAINSLRVTAAHEFFHAIQFGYDTTEDIWFMEGSAVWAEEQVYPSINDYLQYLSFSAIPRPRVPVDYKGVTNTDLFFRYGAVLFWTFLSEQFHDPSVVRRVWEYADGSRYSLQAVNATLVERGWSFRRAFARFGVWNTTPPGTYGDRALFPQPAWWSIDSLGRRHRDTGVRAVALDHLTNAALLLRPARRLPKATRLLVRVSGPALVRMPAATVQLRRRDGSVRIVGVPLDTGGDGKIRVRFNPRRLSAVVVTLTNASLRMADCGTDGSDSYSCGGESVDDRLGFAVRAQVRLP